MQAPNVHTHFIGFGSFAISSVHCEMQASAALPSQAHLSMHDWAAAQDSSFKQSVICFAHFCSAHWHFDGQPLLLQSGNAFAASSVAAPLVCVGLVMAAARATAVTISMVALELVVSTPSLQNGPKRPPLC